VATAGAGKSGPKVAITLRLDVDRVRRLQAIADAEEVTSVKLL
jgi:predicted transcriptional regulator